MHVFDRQRSVEETVVMPSIGPGSSSVDGNTAGFESKCGYLVSGSMLERVRAEMKVPSDA
jgi:hypothetical protein